MNKKGTVEDLFWIMMFLFLVGICILIGHLMKDEILPNIKDQLGTSATGIVTTAEYAFNTLDAIFVFVAVGLCGGAVVLAYLAPSHPAFFFLSILLLIVLMAVAPTMSNAFREFTLDTEFSGIASSYPMTQIIFQHLPLFLLAFGILITIAIFAKASGRRGE